MYKLAVQSSSVLQVSYASSSLTPNCVAYAHGPSTQSEYAQNFTPVCVRCANLFALDLAHSCVPTTQANCRHTNGQQDKCLMCDDNYYIDPATGACQLEMRRDFRPTYSPDYNYCVFWQLPLTPIPCAVLAHERHFRRMNYTISSVSPMPECAPDFYFGLGSRLA